jgi:hypothetical protein
MGRPSGRGPVWHKKDKAAGRIPKGWHGLDVDWIYSTYHGWVYGYKAHVTLSVAPTSVRAVLSATVTGSACESHVLQRQLADLPPTLQTLLLDAGYDDADLLTDCTRRGIRALAPLSKPVSQSTPQTGPLSWLRLRARPVFANAAVLSSLFRYPQGFLPS